MNAPAAEEVLAVYLTFPDAQVAERIATELVESRLVACVNLLPPATSLYRWQGELVKEAEVVGVAKTTRARLAELTRLVEELHPYDVPCLVAYPAVGGSEPYLAWLRQEARG